MLPQPIDEPFWARAFVHPDAANDYWDLVVDVATARWGDEVTFDPFSGCLHLEDGARISIANLAADAVHFDPPAQRAGLYSFFSHFDSVRPDRLLEFTRSWPDVQGSLRVRLWAGKMPFAGLSRPITRNVHQVVVLDHPAGCLAVAMKHFDCWGRSEEEVLKLAHANTKDEVKPDVTIGARENCMFLWFAGGLFTTGLAFDLSELPVAVGERGALICAPTSRDLIVMPLHESTNAAAFSIDLLELTLPVVKREPNPLAVDQLWYRGRGDLVPLIEWDGCAAQNRAPEPMRSWLQL